MTNEERIPLMAIKAEWKTIMLKKTVQRKTSRRKFKNFKNDLHIAMHGDINAIQDACHSLENASANNFLSQEISSNVWENGKMLGDLHRSTVQTLDPMEVASKPSAIEEFKVRYKPVLQKAIDEFSESIHQAKDALGRQQNAQEYIGEVEESLQRLRGSGSVLNLLDSPFRLVRKTSDIHQFLRQFSSGNYVDRDGNPVRIVYRGKSSGTVKFDPLLIREALYNLVTDAINYTPGRPLYVSLGKSGGMIRIGVTSEGRKLTADEIKKIGRMRFTSAPQDPKRGWGKIAARRFLLMHDGELEVGNSRIGPKLTALLPA